MSWIDDPWMGFDTETTGVRPLKDRLVTDRAKGLDYPLVRLYGYKNGSLVAGGLLGEGDGVFSSVHGAHGLGCLRILPSSII